MCHQDLQNDVDHPRQRPQVYIHLLLLRLLTMTRRLAEKQKKSRRKIEGVGGGC